jgi:hypothetical protein
MVDTASEHLSLLTEEFRQQCWFFYLLKRSGIIPKANEEISNEQPGHIDAKVLCTDQTENLDVSDEHTSDDEISATQYPIAIDTPQSIFQKDPAPIRQVDPQVIKEIVEGLVNKSDGYSLHDLEDLGVLVSSVILEHSGSLDHISPTLFSNLI